MSAVSDLPRISAIIPAYNAATFIRRAIDSVMEQTLLPTDIIIVDDGSTDATAEIVERCYPAVRVVRQANGGPGAARNRGVRESSGDWIALLDADDVWLPHKLERQAAYLSESKVGAVHATSASAQYVPDRVSFADLWRRNCIVNSSVLVRRTTWESVGGCDEDRALISVEDYNLWLRIADAGWEIRTCREDLMVYMVEPGHLTSQYERYAAAEIANVERVGTRLNLPASLVDEKRIRTYDVQGRLLLYHRCMRPARSMLAQSLRRKPSLARFCWWLAAYAPQPVLGIRRAVRERSLAPMLSNKVGPERSG